MPINLPNLLTWLRILSIPLLIGVFYCPAHWFDDQQRNLLATVLFVAAALTDWLDGYLARKLNQMSAFGAFLDPVADKLMVAAALILLVEVERLGAVVAIIIIGREIAISALREWMASLGKGKNVAVSMIGKVKTAFQMSAIPMLLYHDSWGPLPIAEIGYWLIHIAAALTLISMFYYLKLAAPFSGGDGKNA